MCQKSHKSFQRTTGQTTFFIFVRGYVMSYSPLTIQREYFMEKNLVIRYTCLNEVVRGPICVIWDNKRVVQHVH